MSADQEGHGVTIAEAARRWGVSENAIRQRIKRGTVAAWKVDGIWRVMLAEDSDKSDQEIDQQVNHQADQDADRQATTGFAVSLAARAQLSAIVEEMLAPLVAQHEERTADLARQIGRLEAERDALWSRLEQMEAEQDAVQTQNKAPGRAEPAAVDADAAASWWARLRRWMAGG